MNPERAAIEKQLERIFASEEFASAPKMRALLRYLVEATQAGDVERLKGYAIGVDVFERGADFDPATDPIVRVQAGRLRKLLDSYYNTTGKGDPLRIDIPKGSYVVEVEVRETAAAGTGAPAVVPPAPRPAVPGNAFRAPRLSLPAGLPPYAVWATIGALILLAVFAGRAMLRSSAPTAPETAAISPAPRSVDAITLAVLPFTDMSKETRNVAFADGFTDALTTALARVKSISLASRTSAFQYREATDLRRVGSELGVGHVVEGSLQRDGERTLVNVQLIDTVFGAHIWAQEYKRAAGMDLALQAELVSTIAGELRPHLYSAAKRALSKSGEHATAWQLFIKSTWVPGEAQNNLAWEKERVALATQAIRIAPDLGQAHSVLADKLAYLASVDPASDTDAARAEAADHARRSLEYAPSDPDVMFNITVYHWHAGHLKEAVEAAERTLELDPNHLLARLHVKVVPYTCAGAPPAVIDDLIAFDAAISPDNPIRWVTLHWVSLLYLNNGDFEKAAEAARRSYRIFRTPNTFYPLAAALVQLGDTKDAVDEIANQRGNWPGLAPRHYADVVIPRRCGDGPKVEFLRRIYSALADAVETAEAKAP
jgi:TolB-like protein